MDLSWEPCIANSVHTQCNSSYMEEIEGSNLYRNMVLDVIGPNINPQYHVDEEEMPDLKTQRLYEMLHKANEPLWESCSKHTQLSAVARLLNIKSEFRMSEKCYDVVLQFMKEALPNDNKLVDSFYETKKFVAN